jgi:hypothetical protein
MFFRNFTAAVALSALVGASRVIYQGLDEATRNSISPVYTEVTGGTQIAVLTISRDME